jgi:hypothetical protein
VVGRHGDLAEERSLFRQALSSSPRTSCIDGAAQRIGQAAFAWSQHGGQTTTFTVVRRGFLTTILRLDLGKQMSADVQGPPPAALAV